MTASPTTTTIYTVTGVDANGCSATKTVTSYGEPIPNVSSITATPAAGICEGGSVNLTASGASTYTLVAGKPDSATAGAAVCSLSDNDNGDLP